MLDDEWKEKHDDELAVWFARMLVDALKDETCRLTALHIATGHGYQVGAAGSMTRLLKHEQNMGNWLGKRESKTWLAEANVGAHGHHL